MFLQNLQIQGYFGDKVRKPRVFWLQSRKNWGHLFRISSEIVDTFLKLCLGSLSDNFFLFFFFEMGLLGCMCKTYGVFRWERTKIGVKSEARGAYQFMWVPLTIANEVGGALVNRVAYSYYRWGDRWRQCPAPAMCSRIMAISIVLCEAMCVHIMVCSGPLLLKLLQHFM